MADSNRCQAVGHVGENQEYTQLYTGLLLTGICEYIYL